MALIALLIGTVGTLLLFPLVLWYLQLYKHRNLGIPGPKPLPIVGNAFDIGSDISTIVPRLQALQKKYGDVFRLYMGPKIVTIFISKPEYVKYFMTSTVHINKSSLYNMFKMMFSEGLVTTNGDNWRMKRRLYTPAFHGNQLEKFMEAFNESGNKLVKIFRNTKEKINVFPYINNFTLDIIIETTFGIPQNDNPNRHAEYLENAREGMEIAMGNAFSITKMIDFVYKLTDTCKREKKAIDTLKRITDDRVRAKILERKQLSKEGYTKNCFVDELLDQFKDEDEAELMDKIREDVDTVVFAGHDTVTAALSFLIYELSKHPDIQDRILQEIDDQLGDDVDHIDIAQLNRLQYIDCVVKESMRLNTVTPFVERIIDEDVRLDDIVLPRGTVLNFLIGAVHASEEHYGNPKVFDPLRFMPENLEKRHPFAFVPFVAGPRNCIGYRYAMLLLKLMVVKIIRHFKILRPIPDFELELVTHGILTSKNGFPVQFQAR